MNSAVTPSRRRAFTLLELLVVVTLMGIAGAMIIPTMGNSQILRVQGAVRQIVSDIAFAQSDAVAFQESRALVFDVANSSYTLVTVPGNSIDVATNALYDPTRQDGRYGADFRKEQFGDSRIIEADFGASANVLIFDAMGGVIAGPGDNSPGQGGTIRVTGARQAFTITIEAFTGRTTVAQDP